MECLVELEHHVRILHALPGTGVADPECGLFGRSVRWAQSAANSHFRLRGRYLERVEWLVDDVGQLLCLPRCKQRDRSALGSSQHWLLCGHLRYLHVGHAAVADAKRQLQLSGRYGVAAVADVWSVVGLVR